MYIKYFPVLLLFCTTIFAQEVYEPESRLLPKRHLYYESAKKISFYIDFISARYGKKFDNEVSQKEFEAQDWYKVNPDYHDSLLNEIDLENIKNLTAIYNSLKSKTDELKSLTGKTVWEKPVYFIENDETQKCIYTVTKTTDGFKVDFVFENKDGIFYNYDYELSLDEFGDTWGGYPFEGTYEAIAKNFEFINIEFYAYESIESQMTMWFVWSREMEEEKAEVIVNDFVKRMDDFKGEIFFTGFLNDFGFPDEYIYLDDEHGFVLIYAP